MKKQFIRLTSGLATIALMCSLTIGCNIKKRNKFYFYQNLKGNIVPGKNDYISSEYIDEYYVIELYNWVLKSNNLYIAYRYRFVDGTSRYDNVFNEYTIAYDNDRNDYYEFINVTPLEDFLVEYDLEKEKYTYNDMLEIYKIIYENYTFENNTLNYNSRNSDNSVVRKRTPI